LCSLYERARETARFLASPTDPALEGVDPIALSLRPPCAPGTRRHSRGFPAAGECASCAECPTAKASPDGQDWWRLLRDVRTLLQKERLPRAKISPPSMQSLPWCQRFRPATCPQKRRFEPWTWSSAMQHPSKRRDRTGFVQRPMRPTSGAGASPATSLRTGSKPSRAVDAEMAARRPK